MKLSTHRLTETRKLSLLTPFVLLIICVMPAITYAGNGTFRNGQFNFCVSVRFDAKDAELQLIRTAFQNGSQILADATDGQHRFGTITIANKSGCSESAEYWVNAGPGRAYATVGQYGVRGQHVMLFFQSDFQALHGADGDAYTIAHEHSHHAYGVLDEYSGPAGDAECKAPPNAATDNFCLMDNYFNRGGRAFGGAYTLNEFCIGAGHDPDADTYEQSVNGRSCWAQIAAHSKRPATAPLGLPISTPPAAHTVTFLDGVDGLRVIFVLDRSGSMDGERIDFAKRAANLFVDFLRDGDSVGVVSFADSATLNFALTEVKGGGTRSAAKSAINSLIANGGTNIGGGLQTALNQITSQTTRSCSSIIVLLSDGDHNVGPTPDSVIPALQDAGVTVLSVGVGSGISAGGQAALQNVANQTGGRYSSVSSSFGLVGLFLRLTYESFGNGLLTRAPMPIATGQTKEVVTMVEAGTASATFAVAIANQSDQITLSLRSPSGQIINEADGASNPSLELIVSPNSRALRVRTPEPGNWRVVVTAGTVSPDGMIEVQAFGDHDGVQLNLSVDKDTLTAAEAVQLFATPRFEGEAVIGATLTGTVTRPDGSSVFIALYDDGLAAHGDAVADDGDYSSRFTQYSGSGTYTFSIKAAVTSGTTAAGEDLFSFDSSSANPVPQFVREATTTAVVTGASTATGAADLVITKTAAPINAVPGTMLTYTIGVSNNGPAAATAVVVSDTLPPTTTFVTCSATNGGVCEGNNNNRRITFNSLASSASASITLIATVNSNATDPAVVNTANVSSAIADTTTTNNVASATVSLPAARAIQFSASRYSAGESDEVAAIMVVRAGDVSTAATVDYITTDGTATQRGDYMFTSGRLSFAPGQTTQIINILINDDAYFEGAETINIILSNPTSGFSLGALNAAVLTIQDNETGQGGTNPLGDPQFFVRQHYHDFLSRQPDTTGLNFWTNGITSCGTNVGCIEVKRVDVSAAFYLSIEFQQTGYLVERIYKAAYGDAAGTSTLNGAHQLQVPIVRLNEFLSDTQEIGRGLVVLQTGWETVLENDKQAFTAEFVQRPRFMTAYPTSMTPTAFVDKLFANADVTPLAADRTAAINEFGSATTTVDAAARGRVLQRVAENGTLTEQEFNRAFVLMQYFGYLRRNPNDPQDTDYTGYDFWLTKLNQFNGNFVNAEMVKAFITSSEYRQRFGP